ncbi:FecR domain-containing protein [Roseateles aquatilis]|uniref:FecR domain-containing protein n=1 Tax=Roseateles aquatilis TaxID=431061 RepID=UPI0013037E89|nr:FecR domain-containing protein [Roseateles aquatilis]
MNEAGDAAGLDARARAVEWFVLLASGNATVDDQRAWVAWREADPAHEAEWARVDRVQQMMAGVPAELASPALRRSGSTRRRQVLRSLGIGAIAGALGYGGWRGVRELGGAAWLADERTAPGEQRQVALEDGSVMTLNTATAVDVRFDAAWRALRLHEGEVLVETAAARGAPGAVDARPLIVDTRLGRVRALGTRFILRLDEHRLTVAVLQSAVETRDPSGRTLRVEAGQQLVVGAQGAGRVEALASEVDAWTYGSLVVDNARLIDVVAELSRYRRGHLGCDPRVSELRVSGAFPVTDVDRALSALVAALPVQIDRVNRFWTTVRPRGA